MTTRLDTSPDARELQVATYRSMGAPRRLMAAIEMSEEARGISVAGISARHPELTPLEVEMASSAILLGPDISSTGS